VFLRFPRALFAQQNGPFATFVCQTRLLQLSKHPAAAEFTPLLRAALIYGIKYAHLIESVGRVPKALRDLQLQLQGEMHLIA
jgi:hypothetical protein